MILWPSPIEKPQFPESDLILLAHTLIVRPHLFVIPKLFLRLIWFFRRTVTLFRQIRTFPQLFRFCSDLGNSGIRQIVRNSMLTGRWWEGRNLINLCGNNNVWNCDLLQSDLFARCRTVLGVAKGCFRRVCGETWKKMRARNIVIFYAGETCY